MTGKTHMICSTAAVSVYALAHWRGVDIGGVEMLPALFVAPAAVGAYMPDMDIQQSRLGSKFKFLSKNMKHRGITHTLVVPTVLAIAAFTMQSRSASIFVSILVGILMMMLFDKKIGTRKKGKVAKVLDIFTSKIGVFATIAMVIMSWFKPSIGSSILFGLFLGWTLHIFEDMFNNTGCPILYPLAKGRVHLPWVAIVKTRHWTEAVFLLLWLGGCAIWALSILAGA